MMNRALVLPLAAWAAALAVNPEKPRRARADAAGPFTVVEATIPQMRAALESGRVTSAELVRQSLVRIATYEDRLNAVITVNPSLTSAPPTSRAIA